MKITKNICTLVVTIFIGMMIVTLPGIEVKASDYHAVTVESVNNNLGVAQGFKNGQSFTYYTYCSDTDYIRVAPVVSNSAYLFTYWTDNGKIVSYDTEYSFQVGETDHDVKANFEQKQEKKNQKYRSKDHIKGVKIPANMSGFASGYKFETVTVNTRLLTADENTRNDCGLLTNGDFVAAFAVSYTNPYGLMANGLKDEAQIKIQLPVEFQRPGKKFSIVFIDPRDPANPKVLKDLDTSKKSVTFASQYNGSYVLTCSK